MGHNTKRFLPQRPSHIFRTNIVVDDDVDAVKREQRQQDEAESMTGETDGSWQDCGPQEAAEQQWDGVEPVHIDEITFVHQVSDQSYLQLCS